MSHKSLKQKVRDGDMLVGIAVPSGIDRIRFKAILDQGPYDFVAVDSQHSPFDERRLVDVCAMAAEFDMPIHFRIKHTRHTYLIGNCLDLGPAGVEVPQVELESTVEEAIEYFYYPPLGKRSYGSMTSFGAKNFEDPFEYAKWWNDVGVLWMQLESVEAVEKVYALAKAGVDCVSFGPIDLSFSLKYSSHPRLKTIDDCVRQVIKTLEGTDVAVCFRNLSAENRRRYIDMGVTVFLEHFRSLKLS